MLWLHVVNQRHCLSQGQVFVLEKVMNELKVSCLADLSFKLWACFLYRRVNHITQCNFHFTTQIVN